MTSKFYRYGKGHSHNLASPSPDIEEWVHFREIKDLVAASALPVENLSHLKQKSLPAKSASKSELLDVVDDLIGAEQNPAEAIQRFLTVFLKQKSYIHSQITQCVQEFGWIIEHGQLHSRLKGYQLISRKMSGSYSILLTRGTGKETIQVL